MNFNPHIEAMMQGMGILPQQQQPAAGQMPQTPNLMNQQENTQKTQQMPSVGGFTSSGAYPQGQQAQAQAGGGKDPLTDPTNFLNGGMAGLIGSFF